MFLFSRKIGFYCLSVVVVGIFMFNSGLAPVLAEQIPLHEIPATFQLPNPRFVDIAPERLRTERENNFDIGVFPFHMDHHLITERLLSLYKVKLHNNWANHILCLRYFSFELLTDPWWNQLLADQSIYSRGSNLYSRGIAPVYYMYLNLSEIIHYLPNPINTFTKEMCFTYNELLDTARVFQFMETARFSEAWYCNSRYSNGDFHTVFVSSSSRYHMIYDQDLTPIAGLDKWTNKLLYYGTKVKPSFIRYLKEGYNNVIRAFTGSVSEGSVVYDARLTTNYLDENGLSPNHLLFNHENIVGRIRDLLNPDKLSALKFKEMRKAGLDPFNKKLWAAYKFKIWSSANPYSLRWRGKLWLKMQNTAFPTRLRPKMKFWVDPVDVSKWKGNLADSVRGFQEFVNESNYARNRDFTGVYSQLVGNENILHHTQPNMELFDNAARNSFDQLFSYYKYFHSWGHCNMPLFGNRIYHLHSQSSKNRDFFKSLNVNEFLGRVFQALGSKDVAFAKVIAAIKNGTSLDELGPVEFEADTSAKLKALCLALNPYQIPRMPQPHSDQIAEMLFANKDDLYCTDAEWVEGLTAFFAIKSKYMSQWKIWGNEGTHATQQQYTQSMDSLVEFMINNKNFFQTDLNTYYALIDSHRYPNYPRFPDSIPTRESRFRPYPYVPEPDATYSEIFKKGKYIKVRTGPFGLNEQRFRNMWRGKYTFQARYRSNFAEFWEGSTRDVWNQSTASAWDWVYGRTLARWHRGVNTSQGMLSGRNSVFKSIDYGKYLIFYQLKAQREHFYQMASFYNTFNPLAGEIINRNFYPSVPNVTFSKSHLYDQFNNQKNNLELTFAKLLQQDVVSPAALSEELYKHLSFVNTFLSQHNLDSSVFLNFLGINPYATDTGHVVGKREQSRRTLANNYDAHLGGLFEQFRNNATAVQRENQLISYLFHEGGINRTFLQTLYNGQKTKDYWLFLLNIISNDNVNLFTPQQRTSLNVAQTLQNLSPNVDSWDEAQYFNTRGFMLRFHTALLNELFYEMVEGSSHTPEGKSHKATVYWWGQTMTLEHPVPLYFGESIYPRNNLSDNRLSKSLIYLRSLTEEETEFFYWDWLARHDFLASIQWLEGSKFMTAGGKPHRVASVTAVHELTKWHAGLMGWRVRQQMLDMFPGYNYMETPEFIPLDSQNKESWLLAPFTLYRKFLRQIRWTESVQVVSAVPHSWIGLKCMKIYVSMFSPIYQFVLSAPKEVSKAQQDFSLQREEWLGDQKYLVKHAYYPMQLIEGNFDNNKLKADVYPRDYVSEREDMVNTYYKRDLDRVWYSDLPLIPEEIEFSPKVPAIGHHVLSKLFNIQYRIDWYKNYTYATEASREGRAATIYYTSDDHLHNSLSLALLFDWYEYPKRRLYDLTLALLQFPETVIDEQPELGLKHRRTWERPLDTYTAREAWNTAVAHYEIHRKFFGSFEEDHVFADRGLESPLDRVLPTTQRMLAWLQAAPKTLYSGNIINIEPSVWSGATLAPESIKTSTSSSSKLTTPSLHTLDLVQIHDMLKQIIQNQSLYRSHFPQFYKKKNIELENKSYSNFSEQAVDQFIKEQLFRLPHWKLKYLNWEVAHNYNWEAQNRDLQDFQKKQQVSKILGLLQKYINPRTTGIFVREDKHEAEGLTQQIMYDHFTDVNFDGFDIPKQTLHLRLSRLSYEIQKNLLNIFDLTGPRSDGGYSLSTDSHLVNFNIQKINELTQLISHLITEYRHQNEKSNAFYGGNHLGVPPLLNFGSSVETHYLMNPMFIRDDILNPQPKYGIHMVRTVTGMLDLPFTERFGVHGTVQKFCSDIKVEEFGRWVSNRSRARRAFKLNLPEQIRKFSLHIPYPDEGIEKRELERLIAEGFNYQDFKHEDILSRTDFSNFCSNFVLSDNVINSPFYAGSPAMRDHAHNKKIMQADHGKKMIRRGEYDELLGAMRGTNLSSFDTEFWNTDLTDLFPALSLDLRHDLSFSLSDVDVYSQGLKDNSTGPLALFTSEAYRQLEKYAGRLDSWSRYPKLSSYFAYAGGKTGFYKWLHTNPSVMPAWQWWSLSRRAYWPDVIRLTPLKRGKWRRFYTAYGPTVGLNSQLIDYNKHYTGGWIAKPDPLFPATHFDGTWEYPWFYLNEGFRENPQYKPLTLEETGRWYHEWLGFMYFKHVDNISTHPEDAWFSPDAKWSYVRFLSLEAKTDLISGKPSRGALDLYRQFLADDHFVSLNREERKRLSPSPIRHLYQPWFKPICSRGPFDPDKIRLWVSPKKWRVTGWTKGGGRCITYAWGIDSWEMPLAINDLRGLRFNSTVRSKRFTRCALAQDLAGRRLNDVRTDGSSYQHPDWMSHYHPMFNGCQPDTWSKEQNQILHIEPLYAKLSRGWAKAFAERPPLWKIKDKSDRTNLYEHWLYYGYLPEGAANEIGGGTNSPAIHNAIDLSPGYLEPNMPYFTNFNFLEWYPAIGVQNISYNFPYTSGNMTLDHSNGCDGYLPTAYGESHLYQILNWTDHLKRRDVQVVPSFLKQKQADFTIPLIENLPILGPEVKNDGLMGAERYAPYWTPEGPPECLPTPDCKVGGTRLCSAAVPYNMTEWMKPMTKVTPLRWIKLGRARHVNSHNIVESQLSTLDHSSTAVDFSSYVIDPFTNHVGGPQFDDALGATNPKVGPQYWDYDRRDARWIWDYAGLVPTSGVAADVQRGGGRTLQFPFNNLSLTQYKDVMITRVREMIGNIILPRSIAAAGGSSWQTRFGPNSEYNIIYAPENNYPENTPFYFMDNIPHGLILSVMNNHLGSHESNALAKLVLGQGPYPVELSPEFREKLGYYYFLKIMKTFPRPRRPRNEWIRPMNLIQYSTIDYIRKSRRLDPQSISAIRKILYSTQDDGTYLYDKVTRLTAKTFLKRFILDELRSKSETERNNLLIAMHKLRVVASQKSRNQALTGLLVDVNQHKLFSRWVCKFAPSDYPFFNPLQWGTVTRFCFSGQALKQKSFSSAKAFYNTWTPHITSSLNARHYLSIFNPRCVDSLDAILVPYELVLHPTRRGLLRSPLITSILRFFNKPKSFYYDFSEPTTDGFFKGLKRRSLRTPKSTLASQATYLIDKIILSNECLPRYKEWT